MKIRTGFVSNSSSSSFCIYGTEFKPTFLNKDTLLRLAKEQDLDIDDYDGVLEDMASEIDFYDFKFDDGLDVFGNYDVGYFIGKSLSSIGDDETGRQFKENIEKSLLKLGVKNRCSVIEEAWYDG